MIPAFEGTKSNGKLVIPKHVRFRMNRWIETIKDGTSIEIIIRPAKKRVTNDQRGYYWGVVVPIIAEYFGYDKDEAHEALKAEFNPVPSKINPNQKIGGSTTKLSAEEFYRGETSYVERIVRWAAVEYGIDIPAPNEVFLGDSE